MKNWAPDSPKSHLLGGMTYKDGCLTVPQSGTYYVYVKIHFMSRGRVLIRVNGIIANYVSNQEEHRGEVQVGRLIILKD